jgi:ATP:corrinoid adenosyltransferase
MWIHSVFHAFMLQHCNQIISLQIIKTSVELDEEYEVKNILKKKMISEKVHYFVKWKNYNISENIWKLKENLKNCVKML